MKGGHIHRAFFNAIRGHKSCREGTFTEVCNAIRSTNLEGRAHLQRFVMLYGDTNLEGRAHSQRFVLLYGGTNLEREGTLF